uniref:hypothetical protein n=1 Tax=Eubacterium cellulosolvens TaxID=29322 RepID=UPI00138AFDCD
MNYKTQKTHYESLPLVTIRGIAKARGFTKVSSSKKEDLITRLLRDDQRNAEDFKEKKASPITAPDFDDPAKKRLYRISKIFFRTRIRPLPPVDT